MIPAKASRALAEASGGRRFNIGRGELLLANLEVIITIIMFTIIIFNIGRGELLLANLEVIITITSPCSSPLSGLFGKCESF